MGTIVNGNPVYGVPGVERVNQEPGTVRVLHEAGDSVAKLIITDSDGNTAAIFLDWNGVCLAMTRLGAAAAHM